MNGGWLNLCSCLFSLEALARWRGEQRHSQGNESRQPALPPLHSPPPSHITEHRRRRKMCVFLHAIPFRLLIRAVDQTYLSRSEAEWKRGILDPYTHTHTHTFSLLARWLHYPSSVWENLPPWAHLISILSLHFCHFTAAIYPLQPSPSCFLLSADLCLLREILL